MGWVDVTHFKAGALTRQTARPKCRDTPLVGNFRQRVGLVHELRQLGRAKEFPHSGSSRLGVDQIGRHHSVDFNRPHTLANGTLHAQQAYAILVFHQLADRPDTPVAKMVDIIHITATVLQPS